MFLSGTVFCGALFYKVENTIAGFQNRMGVFFFIEALFAFGCLTSLQVFAVERILFVRERANGYYQPFTYFLSKVRSGYIVVLPLFFFIFFIFIFFKQCKFILNIPCLTTPLI